MEDIRILLVEDVAINRYVIMGYLQSWQHIQADEASNGLEAVEKVKAKDYDIILMDIHMPEMDGCEAAKVIRSLERPKGQAIPIIALTANTEQDLKSENGHDFTDVVTKPFNPNELYSKVIQYASAAKSGVVSHKTEEVREEELKEVISYQCAEVHLRGNTSRILNFYHMAEKALADYRQRYQQAIEQLDAVAIDNINHKASVTLKMLGLEKTLQLRLEEGKTLVERQAPQEEVKELLDEVIRWFEEVTEAVRLRRDHIHQHGLE